MLVRDICIVESNNYQQNENWSYFNYLDTGNLTKNKIDSLQSINSVDDLPSRAKQKVTINDILYSSVRPNQQHYGFIDQQYDNLLVSTGFIILRPIIQKVIPKYLYYYLTQDKITNQLQVIAQNSTSSYPSITKDDLLNLEIHLPPIEEQEKIALILTKIDKQIGRNNAMVKKLQVLTHDSFDYFSRENNSSNSVMLKDIIIEKEKSPIQVNNVEKTSGNIPFFTSGETILYTYKGLTSGFNIFLSTGGNAKIQSYYGEVSYSTDTWCITAKKDLQYYLYGYLKHIESQMDKLYFHGTGLKHLQKPIFLKSVINIPTNDMLIKFNEIVEPIYSQISRIEQSNVKLQRIKNQLLPLLINQQLG